MATKTLTTRIVNKHATLASWNSSSIILKEGEIALAKIASADNYSAPTFLMKVGDGTSKFSALNWLAAPASDVYAWAKKTALAYEDLPEALRSSISTLETAIGTGGVVEANIKAAIDALDVTDTAVAKQFVTAVSETDGKITVTRRALTADDIPTLGIDKINGLQAALDAKETVANVTALAGRVTTAEGKITTEIADRTAGDEALDNKIDGVAEDLAEEVTRAKAAEQANATAAADAKSAADKAQGEVDALEQTVATLTQTVGTNKTNIEASLAQEKEARQQADNALQGAIDALEEAIGNVTNIMNFRGAFDAKSKCTAPVEGDVIVVTAGDDAGKEFVYSNGAWVEFGTTSAQDAAIAALQGRMSTAEGKITTLEQNAAMKSDVDADIAALAETVGNMDTAYKAADTAIKGRLDTAEGKITTLEGKATDHGTRITTAEGKITALEQASATHATKSYVEGEVAALEETIGNLDTAYKAADTAIKGRLDTAEADIDELQKDVAAAEKTIGEHTTAISGINGTIATLATNANLEAAKERISAIEADYLTSKDVLILDCGGIN